MVDMGQAGGALIDQLGSLSSRRAMVAFLRHQPQLWNPAVVESLYERVVRVARADLRQAERLADAAAWLADKLDDDRCRAQSLRAIGHVLLIRRQYGEALKRYEAALQLFRTAGQDVDVGRTLSGGAMQSLIYLGRHQDALTSAKEARRIFERHGDRLRLARLDSNVGNIFLRQSRFQEALALYERAHEQLVQIGEPQDVAAVLINMATCCTNLNEFQKALDSYDHARRYCQTHDMPLLVAQADYNIAYLYYLRGEYTRALELYRAAEKQSDEVGDAFHRALCDLDRSELYLELNLNDEAKDLAARALVRFEKLGLSFESAKAVANLATAASRDGETERALELFDRARELFIGEGNQVWLALVDFYQALVLYRDQRYLQAQRLCQSALKLFTRASLPGRAALCELLLARLELDAGDPRAAEQACRAALERAEAAQSPMLNYQAYFVLGLIREAQREPQAAYAAFERSCADLERLRSDLGAEDLKVAFFKDKLAVYENLVAIGLTLGPERQRQEAAFGYIERAKSRSLADLIAFRAGTLAPRVESDLGDEVQRLRQQINWHARQIELEELKREKRSARRITDASPARADAREPPGQVTAGGAGDRSGVRRAPGRHGLQPRGNSRGRGARHGAARVLPGSRSDLRVRAQSRAARRRAGRVRARREEVAAAPSIPALEVRPRLAVSWAPADRQRGATEAHLAELYTILVAPIRDRLQADHLVIVPHDLLHYLPFHALFDGARFLIDEFTISYAPSASVYRLCCAKRPRSDGQALVMGVPDARAPYIV